MNTPKPKPPTAARSAMVNGRYTTTSSTSNFTADPKALARIMRGTKSSRKVSKSSKRGK